MYTVTFSAGALFGLGVLTGLVLGVAILCVIAVAANKKSK